jgi:hypothetical protein
LSVTFPQTCNTGVANWPCWPQRHEYLPRALPHHGAHFVACLRGRGGVAPPQASHVSRLARAVPRPPLCLRLWALCACAGGAAGGASVQRWHTLCAPPSLCSHSLACSAALSMDEQVAHQRDVVRARALAERAMRLDARAPRRAFEQQIVQPGTRPASGGRSALCGARRWSPLLPLLLLLLGRAPAAPAEDGLVASGRQLEGVDEPPIVLEHGSHE